MIVHNDLEKVFWPTPRLAPIAARNWIKTRILAGTPTSLIRLGDGEFSWLGYRSIALWEQTATSLNVWFGRDNFEPVLLEETADRLRLAVRRATVIGLPRPSRQMRDPFCGYVRDLFDLYELTTPGQLFTDCGVHRFWQMLLAYRDLLAGLPFLGLVSSRDIGDQIRATFGIDDLVLYPVPSERGMLGAFENLGPHYPERFQQICDELVVPFRGAVFLIGAGALGKIYADIVFQRGGIALDVGSVLDGWATKASRGFLKQDPYSFGLNCYHQTSDLPPEEILARYRDLLTTSFYAHLPSNEEIAFYEELSLNPRTEY
jgi:hypothetical protein